MRTVFGAIVVMVSLAGMTGWNAALAGGGTFTVSYVTGRPETHVFAGHPGWVDAYAAGGGEGISGRIGDDGKFTLPAPAKDKPLCLIAMFDGIETPPIIVPSYPAKADREILIPTEYACVPGGYPDVWDKEYLQSNHHWFQVFVPQCTQIYGCTIFDGPKALSWGNKFNATLHEDGPRGKPIFIANHDGNRNIDFMSGGHSDHGTPRCGWRHGDLEVVPGRTYAMCAGGYNSHGGERVPLPAYIRPDKGDGYAQGEVFKDNKPTGGDLCCLIFGNSHGQLVENHIRSEEWEIFVPGHRPTRSWAQTFKSNGVSLAGVSFWASDGDNSRAVKCDVKIRPEGEWERPIGPVKRAVGHESPVRPIIRYPDAPKPVEGYEAYYRLPCKLFQVACMPDEIPLKPGKTYYIEVTASEPILMYADGDFYDHGYAYYEGLKVDRLGYPRAFHSDRWTLAMNIVTYARPGGASLTQAAAR